MSESIIGTIVEKTMLLNGLERCHIESIDAIIKIEAIRINGAKIVL